MTVITAQLLTCYNYSVMLTGTLLCTCMMKLQPCWIGVPLSQIVQSDITRLSTRKAKNLARLFYPPKLLYCYGMRDP